MKVLVSYTSPYARKVRIVLREKGIAHEELHAWEGPLHPRSVSPLAKVPTLVLDDETALYDSAVITRYLEESFPNPRMVPAEGPARWRVLRWEAIADGLSDLLIPVVMERRRRPEHQDPEFISRWEERGTTVLQWLAEQVTGRTFVEGDSFTLADAALVAALAWVEFRRPDLIAPFGELRRYLKEHAARPSCAETVPRD